MVSKSSDRFCQSYPNCDGRLPGSRFQQDGCGVLGNDQSGKPDHQILIGRLGFLGRALGERSGGSFLVHFDKQVFAVLSNQPPRCRYRCRQLQRLCLVFKILRLGSVVIPRAFVEFLATRR